MASVIWMKKASKAYASNFLANLFVVIRSQINTQTRFGGALPQGKPRNCFYSKNTTTKENETLLAIGTAFVQGEDVAARGHVLLFSVDRNPDNSQTLVPEVYSKELKGAISALASLQGHLKGAISALASPQSLLLIASGPKIYLGFRGGHMGREERFWISGSES